MQRQLAPLALILLVGCTPKLDESRSFSADVNGQLYDLPPIKAEQKINVVANATGGPIDVYVFLSKNKAAVERDVMAKKLTGLLASDEKKESVNLQAIVPPGEGTTVWVKASTLKNANVKLKMTN